MILTDDYSMLFFEFQSSSVASTCLSASDAHLAVRVADLTAREALSLPLAASRSTAQESTSLTFALTDSPTNRLTFLQHPAWPAPRSALIGVDHSLHGSSD